MKLQAGKRYVLRNGEITPPIRAFYGSNFDIDNSVKWGPFLWYSEGTFCFSGADPSKDIIKEYKPIRIKW